MDKERIYRELAEKLEPLAGFESLDRFERCVFDRSPNGFWSFNWRSWLPFNPFVEEDDCARLLDAMPACDLRFLPPNHYLEGGTVGAWHWLCLPDGVNNRTMYAAHEDRRSAIVLAACKWLGILLVDSAESAQTQHSK